jgi:predicted deacylase
MTAIVVLIVLIVIALSPPAVDAVRVGDPTKPTVLVLAGTHGNEPAPAHYLERLAAELEQRPARVPSDVHFGIVPRVNRAAMALGNRTGLDGVDMNRCWPDPAGKYCSPVKTLVDRAALVIDLHEAWSFQNQDPGSLGQTIFTNDERLYPLVNETVHALNQNFGHDESLKWSRIGSLPALPDGTALDQYCESKKIPYILVEVAGQRDIVPRELRMEQCRVALGVLLGI